MADVAVVGVGLGLAYMAYKQITAKGKELDQFQAGLFKESDMASLERNNRTVNGVDRMGYNAESPDPSLDHYYPELQARKRRNRPVRVNPMSKPAIF